MFRTAFKDHRCLIVADGFYEWQDQRGSKQPYCICRDDRNPFAFAGLWSHWGPESGDGIRETMTILTTDANEAVEAVHDRMPVMLEPDEYEVWLHGDPDEAQTVLDPYPYAALDVYPVRKQVNVPSTESPELFEKIDIGEQTGLGDSEGD